MRSSRPLPTTRLGRPLGRNDAVAAERRSMKRAVVLLTALLTVAPVCPAMAVGPTAMELSAENTVVASVSTRITVVAPRAFKSPTALFNPTTVDFDSTRANAGFALVYQGKAGEVPPVLVGVATPFTGGQRRLLFPFGEDATGSNSFDNYTFPAGTYELMVFTDKLVTIHFRLLGLPRERSPHVLRPTRRVTIPMQHLAAARSTNTGSVLGSQAPVGLAARNVLIQTVVTRFAPSATGYNSFWCQYSAPPADGRYLPRCLNGSGTC
jgi:hypothetical protein